MTNLFLEQMICNRYSVGKSGLLCLPFRKTTYFFSDFRNSITAAICSSFKRP